MAGFKYSSVGFVVITKYDERPTQRMKHFKVSTKLLIKDFAFGNYQVAPHATGRKEMVLKW